MAVLPSVVAAGRLPRLDGRGARLGHAARSTPSRPGTAGSWASAWSPPRRTSSRPAWDLVSSGTFTAAWTATARDLVFLALYVWLLVRLWRSEGGLRSPWVAYSAAVLVVPLSSGTITSMARFGLMAFPLVWPLADWIGEDRGRALRWGGAAAVVIGLLVAQLAIRSP